MYDLNNVICTIFENLNVSVSHYQKLVIAQTLPTILTLFRYFASFKISQKKLEVTVKKKISQLKLFLEH